MGLDRKLSPLEMATLGVVSKAGPITAYALMRNFAESGAGYYRSRAGSIYPLVKRLAEASLLVAEDGNGRAERAYRISDEGLVALREWVAPPFAPEEFACALDPFRSRAYALELLTAEQRADFFRAVEEGLEALLARCEEIVQAYREGGDEVDVLAATGALFETKARLEWIRHMRDRLVTTGGGAAANKNGKPSPAAKASRSAKLTE